MKRFSTIPFSVLTEFYTRAMRTSLFALFCTSCGAPQMALVDGPRYQSEAPVPVKLGPRPSPPTPVLSANLTFEERTLKNGLRVVVVPRNGSPVTAVSLGLLGGYGEDGPRHGEALLSHLTWLGRNAHTLRADLAEHLVESGSAFGMSVDADHVHVSIVGVEEQLEAMIEFMAAARDKRRVGEQAFDRRQTDILDELWEFGRNPIARAHREVHGLAFGAHHPYGHLANGRRHTLGKVDLARVKAHLSKSLCPDRAVLVVSGPAQMGLVHSFARRYLGKWKTCRKRATHSIPNEVPKRKRVVIIHDPDRVQTVLVGGLAASGIDANGAASLRTFADVLGGSMSSRLHASLREQRGLTYGAHVLTSIARGAGLMILQTRLDPDRIQPALELVLQSVNSLNEKPLTKAEIERAHLRRAAKSLAMARSPLAASSYTVERIAADLPIDQEVTPSAADLKSFATKHLSADRLQIVLVGDAKRLRPIVNEAGLGEPRILH